MADSDPFATQREVPPQDFAPELRDAGFGDPKEIGRGGFGVVYRCRQVSLDRFVAVKLLTADLDEENLERFLREQRAMGRLSGHPNIANVLEVGTTAQGRPFIVMPFHARGSLETRIRDGGPLSWQAALRLGIKLSGALETAHRNGILHRDVKPGNVLLTEYAEPQLTDFGIARVTGGFETSTGAITGSPAYAAPEVLKGAAVGPTADIYGLGATLFCALTGHAAFERQEGEKVVAQFLRITSQPVPDLRGGDIPDEVVSAIEHAMAGAPSQRPGSAADFGEELREVQVSCDEPADIVPLPSDLDVAPRSSGTGGPRTGRTGRSLSTTPPPTPATKFRPPESAKSLVGRPRLLETLRAGGQRRLIVIHAPSGYGKSILASQWRDVLIGEGIPVAWLTVDGDDNNAVWFLAHLVEAIRRAGATAGAGLRDALEEKGLDAERFVLTTLIDSLHEQDERVAVVIDDWHRVDDAETVAALGFLFENGCHHLQIIVTTRTLHGLPLSRMRMSDELVEIGAEAIRFEVPESRMLLVELGGLALDEGDIAALTGSTDGWVAGLQLASLSLRGRGNAGELIEQLDRHQGIGEFLAEDVLDGLEPEVLEFLLGTSVTERVSGALASALVPGSSGQAMLEKLEERGLFLRRVDETGRWFRYHHLFSQFLQHRLERDNPGRLEELHRVAAMWFADHGTLNRAVDHALAVRDQKLAVELVERDGMALLERARTSTLLGIIDKLPPHLVQASVRLQMLLAWGNNELLRRAPARAALDRAHVLLNRGELSASERADLEIEAHVIEAAARCYQDQVFGIEGLIAECLARPDSLRPWVVSAAADLACYAAVYRFAFDDARRMQDWALPYHERTGHYGLVWSYCMTGIGDIEELDIAGAEDKVRTALRIAVESGGAHSFTARLASALLGELRYEQGALDEARELLEETYALGSESVDFMVGPYVIGARILALQGDRDAAAQRLDEGNKIAADLALPRLRARVDNERGRLSLPNSHWPPPVVDYDDRREPADGVDAITIQFDEFTAIMELLQDGTEAGIDLALAWATDWVDSLRGTGRYRALLQANRLLAACLDAAGRDEEAEFVLAVVASQCAERGMNRFVLDGGPPIPELIARMCQRRLDGRWDESWPELPRAFAAELLSTSTG
ncbi:serine/threonine-protein kinase [Aldersonia kunmingensis]|uniref:serine/threonine-protein kinase n=1 Tax=Aldersonia kunmingensis TaxID=408066 RepID=UPI00082B74AF|nr:serine/threonine-protein kinase [Aldersonia kunmingensis]